MSQYNDTGCKAFEADAAIGQYERVKLDSDGKVTKQVWQTVELVRRPVPRLLPAMLLTLHFTANPAP